MVCIFKITEKTVIKSQLEAYVHVSLPISQLFFRKSQTDVLAYSGGGHLFQKLLSEFI